MAQLLETVTDAVAAAKRVAKTRGFGAAWMRTKDHLADMAECRRFVKDARRADSVDDMISLVFASSAMRPLQIVQEIADLAKTVKQLAPRRMLEIGTAEGGTLSILSRCAAPDAIIMSH